jgi:ribonuclease HI
MATKKEKIVTPVEIEHGIVLYTDGSCKPSRGVGGWGIHGYTYNILSTKEPVGKKINASTNLGYHDGETIKVQDDLTTVAPLQYLDSWGTIPGETTNNVAELTAAINGLNVVREKDARTAVILSDSQYVLKGLKEWSIKWQANNWIRDDGSPVPNAELWTTFIDQNKTLIEDGYQIRWDWVRGHNGNLGNELADYNANRGQLLSKKGLDETTFSWSDAKGYWNPKVEYNRMFSHPRWYFSTNAPNSGISSDNRFIYYCGDHGAAKDNDLLGKAVSDHSYCVLFLKQPEPVLEVIRNAQNAVTSSMFDIVVGYLNKIFSQATYHEISTHGDKFLTQATPVHQDLYCLDEQPVTWVARPPRLSFRAVEYLNILEVMLEGFIDTTKALKKITVTDITSYFYESELVKDKLVTKLCASINNTLKSISVVAQYDIKDKLETTSVPLTIAIDLPNRNSLSALAVRNPKVSLLTFRESDNGFRYVVVIEAGEDIGIWSSVHSNLKIIPDTP